MARRIIPLKERGLGERPSWEEWFMFIANWAATRSSCKHLQTGAVIVKDKRVLSTGYNGAPPGIQNCLERGCRKDKEGIQFNDKGKGVCRGTHAEINAMHAISREEMKGTTMYSLYFPCSSCAKAIAGSGISRVYYSLIYEEIDSLTQEILAESGIAFNHLSLDIENDFKMIRGIYCPKK